MRRLFLSIALISAVASYSQKEVLLKIPAAGKTISAFIPEGYDTLSAATGDLNKDNVADYVLVLRSQKEEAYDPNDSLPGRILVVLIKKGDSYTAAAKSIGSILGKDDGGVFGDPFEEVEVVKGILVIRHYGGSAWRWGYTHKFRFQNNAFFLIGQTTISYWNVSMCEKLGEFAATDYEDINFLTGSYQKKKVSEEGCRFLVNKKGKRPVKPLVKLEDFSIGD